MTQRRFGRLLGFLLGIAAVLLAMGGPVHAQGFTITYTFDEFGHSLVTNSLGFRGTMPASVIQDPGPGGLVTLNLGLLGPPNGVTVGDLVILEPGGGISDIIRFDTVTGGGSLFFYSDNTDPDDTAQADVGFPSAANTNVLTVTEVGPEGDNGFTYTPIAGQPGFIPGTGGTVTYVIISDGTLAPEPGSLALLALAGGLPLGVVVTRFRIRRK